MQAWYFNTIPGAESFSFILFCLQVDIEANAYLAKAESVDYVPTFKIFKNGFKVKELQGPNHEALELAVSHFSL